MTRAYIGVGSNLGRRRQYIASAIERLGAVDGIRVVRCSTVYETRPVSVFPQGDYLNAVLEIETALAPDGLLEAIGAIEKALGRVRLIQDGPRTIDLDILFFGEKVIEQEDLIVPHPRLHERVFVLKGMDELAPDLVHPGLHTTVHALYERITTDSAQAHMEHAQGWHEDH